MTADYVVKSPDHVQQGGFARAAVAIATVTLEMNISALQDASARKKLLDVVERAEHITDEAERVSRAVRMGERV